MTLYIGWGIWKADGKHFSELGYSEVVYFIQQTSLDNVSRPCVTYGIDRGPSQTHVQSHHIPHHVQRMPRSSSRVRSCEYFIEPYQDFFFRTRMSHPDEQRASVQKRITVPAQRSNSQGLSQPSFQQHDSEQARSTLDIPPVLALPYLRYAQYWRCLQA